VITPTIFFVHLLQDYPTLVCILTVPNPSRLIFSHRPSNDSCPDVPFAGDDLFTLFIMSFIPCQTHLGFRFAPPAHVSSPLPHTSYLLFYSFLFPPWCQATTPRHPAGFQDSVSPMAETYLPLQVSVSKSSFHSDFLSTPPSNPG